MGGVGDCGTVGGDDGKDIAPCIVGVMTHPIDFLLAGGVLLGIEDSFYIPLGVYGVVVLGESSATVVGVPETKGLALFVIGENHNNSGISIREAFLYHSAILSNIGMDYIVYDFLRTDTLGIIIIGIGLVPYGKACKLSAMLPCQVGIGFDTIGIVDGVATYYITANRTV